MRLISALIATAVIASPVFAQEVKIKGNTNIAASQNNTAAIAVGHDEPGRAVFGAEKVVFLDIWLSARPHDGAEMTRQVQLYSWARGRSQSQ